MEQTFCKNLKALRAAKGMTQEQVAEKLNVSSQAVSRWECGTGTPDIMLLPEIARLYCVTVDDLYKEKTVAYENYAQRLSSLYEYTRKPEDFFQAEQEFKKLMNSGSYSMDDIRTYGVIHHFMMNYCKDKALEMFDRILNAPEEKTEFTYSKTKAQKFALLTQIGRGKEVVDEQITLLENGCRDSMEYALLLLALCQQEKYEEAYIWFEKSIALFPEDWTILVHGGDICESLGRYEEAFRYWDKAIALDKTYPDPLYSKAFCYEKLGKKEQACKCWMEIENELRKIGLEYEAEEAKDNVKRLMV